MHPENRGPTLYNLFQFLLKFIRPAQRKIFNINGSVRIKLLIKFRLGFSHLRDNTFKHGFRDILNPLYPSSIEAEATTHYFLRCHFFNANRSSPMNDLNETDHSFST